MGIVNMLLSLPAGKQMLALPAEQSAPLSALMQQLREQANAKAAIARERGDEALVDYWRLVAGFAKHVARAFNRERQVQGKSQVSQELMSAFGVAHRQPPAAFDRYAGMSLFRSPAARENECVLEATHTLFSPLVEEGDLLSVDLTARRLTSDGLYLVAVGGNYLAICGFHKGPHGWLVLESGNGTPRKVRMREDRLPEGFEIVGRVRDVYKRDTDRKRDERH